MACSFFRVERLDIKVFGEKIVMNSVWELV
jgi:hypothetical protein